MRAHTHTHAGVSNVYLVAANGSSIPITPVDQVGGDRVRVYMCAHTCMCAHVCVRMPTLYVGWVRTRACVRM